MFLIAKISLHGFLKDNKGILIPLKIRKWYDSKLSAMKATSHLVMGLVIFHCNIDLANLP